MGITAHTLRHSGLDEQVKEMFDRAKEAGNYYEDLVVISEYVNITSVADIPDEGEEGEEE